MDTPSPAPSQDPIPTPPGNLDDRQWKVILHLSAFAGFVCPAGNIIGPLVVWLIKKTDLPGLEPEGRKVLNFQISYTIYGIAAVIVAAVASCLVVPIVLPIAVGIAWLVFTIIGAIKASNGEAYTFPGVIKFL